VLGCCVEAVGVGKSESAGMVEEPDLLLRRNSIDGIDIVE